MVFDLSHGEAALNLGSRLQTAADARRIVFCLAVRVPCHSFSLVLNLPHYRQPVLGHEARLSNVVELAEMCLLCARSKVKYRIVWMGP